MKKELLIYLFVLIILSFIVHSDQWMSNPIGHFLNLKNSSAYGFGSFHPFVFTLIIYIILFIPRAIIKLFKK